MCEWIDSYARERELQGMMKEKISLLIKLLKQKLGHVSKELVIQIEVSSEDK